MPSSFVSKTQKFNLLVLSLCSVSTSFQRVGLDGCVDYSDGRCAIQVGGRLRSTLRHCNRRREHVDRWVEVFEIRTNCRTKSILFESTGILLYSYVFSYAGETLPVTKTPPTQSHADLFSVKEQSRHMLYSGTLVLQARAQLEQPVSALVVRTGTT